MAEHGVTGVPVGFNYAFCPRSIALVCQAVAAVASDDEGGGLLLAFG